MNVGTAQVFRVAAPYCPAAGAVSAASDKNLIPVKCARFTKGFRIGGAFLRIPTRGKPCFPDWIVLDQIGKFGRPERRSEYGAEMPQVLQASPPLYG